MMRDGKFTPAMRHAHRRLQRLLPVRTHRTEPEQPLMVELAIKAVKARKEKRDAQARRAG